MKQSEVINYQLSSIYKGNTIDLPNTSIVKPCSKENHLWNYTFHSGTHQQTVAQDHIFTCHETETFPDYAKSNLHIEELKQHTLVSVTPLIALPVI